MINRFTNIYIPIWKERNRRKNKVFPFLLEHFRLSFAEDVSYYLQNSWDLKKQG